MDTSSEIACILAACPLTDSSDTSHFMKVWSFTRILGPFAGLTARDQQILEVAALFHDSGNWKLCRQNPNSVRKIAEKEGSIAHWILKNLSFKKKNKVEFIGEVCWLIEHYRDDGTEKNALQQCLTEADFLTEKTEQNMDPKKVRKQAKDLIKSEIGKRMLNGMFPAD